MDIDNGAVNNVGACPHEHIDAPVNILLVPRYRRGGENNGVSRVNLHGAVRPGSDPAQRCIRFSLTARTNDQYPVILITVNMLHIDQHAIWNTNISQLLPDCKYLLHTPADYSDLTVALHRRLYYLLQTMHA
ncbi:hypothetical protein D3C77_527420 [compost metagenome]